MQDEVLHTITSEFTFFGLDEATKTQSSEEVQDQVLSPWRLILFDDNIHTFDEVIEQLIKATGL